MWCHRERQRTALPKRVSSAAAENKEKKYANARGSILPFHSIQSARSQQRSFILLGRKLRQRSAALIHPIHPSIAAASHSRKDLHSFLAKYTKTRSRQGPLTNGLIERSAPPAPNILFCNLLVFLLLISNQLSRNTWAHN